MIHANVRIHKTFGKGERKGREKDGWNIMVVRVLFVPAESEQRQLLGILIQDGRMLKVSAGIVCTSS